MNNMRKPAKEKIKQVMSYLGSRTSRKKTRAAKRNGKLGGRPKKNDKRT